MKHEIMIVADTTESFSEIYKALYPDKIDVILVNNIEAAKVGLKEHNPAFLLLDCDNYDINSLLDEIMIGFYRPYPYIIVAASFSNGTTRASILRNGADTCIEKPICAEDILAVIDAVLRRGQRNAAYHQGTLLPCIEHRELAIDPLRRRVTMHDEEIGLTVKEFDVLYALASCAGAVLTKEEIYRYVWHVEPGLNTLIVADHISSIRRKLGLSRKDNNYIQTVFGIGYRFEK